MATYREAWSLFQDEPELTPSNVNSSTGPGTGMGTRTITPDQSTITTSNTELVSELRRLRQDLQELQSASNSNQIPQMSDRPNSFTSATQADNSLRHQAPGSQKLETFRCWGPCCKGRLFSNRSNLIRHQRERKGESAKLRCSFCDAVFLRSSARNAHEAARRCRR